MATDLFDDHNYCKPNKNNVKINKAENHKNFNICQEKIFAYEINNSELMEFDVQNCVEIQCNDEIQNDVLEKVINFNSNINIENIDSNNDVPKLKCSEIVEEINSINTLDDVNISNISEVINSSTTATENEYTMNDNMEIIESQCSNDLPLNNHDSTFTSYTTEDSGIESMDSLLFTESEDSFLDCCLNTDHCYSFSKEKDGEQKSYFNKRKADLTSVAIISTNVENSDEIKDKSEIPAKRFCKSREVIISEESPIIEGEYDESRRVTRLLVKTSDEKPVKYIDNTPGKFVWGYFRSGWWPGKFFIYVSIFY